MVDEVARPYTAELVFALEMDAEVIARLLHDEWAPRGSWRRMDRELLEWLIYDAMIALREAMIDEEGE